MKKIKIWIAVDGSGLICAYTSRPKWDKKDEMYRSTDNRTCFFIGDLPSHSGKCWRQEIVPPSAKKRGAVPPFAERGDEAALRKHEKEPFR